MALLSSSVLFAYGVNVNRPGKSSTGGIQQGKLAVRLGTPLRELKLTRPGRLRGSTAAAGLPTPTTILRGRYRRDSGRAGVLRFRSARCHRCASAALRVPSLAIR